MTTRSKVITTTISIIIILCIMAVGVFAVTTSQIAINNEVEFTGNAQVYVSVGGTMVNEKGESLSIYTGKTYAGDAPETDESATALGKWENIDKAALAADNSFYEYIFVLENKSATEILTVTVSTPKQGENVDVLEFSIMNGSEVAAFDTAIEIPKGEQITIKVKVAVKDKTGASFNVPAVSFTIDFANKVVEA